MKAVGRNIGRSPEGHISIPPSSVSEAQDLILHAAACFSNPRDVEADIDITLSSTDGEPVGLYRADIG